MKRCAMIHRNPKIKAIALVFLILSLGISNRVQAELKLHSLFSDAMVLQRDKPIRIFGSAQPNDQISVSFSDKETTAKTDSKGNWIAKLPPLAANSKPAIVRVKNITRNEERLIKDVLVGDVWVLGGQSNMELELHKIFDGDLEVLSANHPNIRLMTVPKNVGPKKVPSFDSLNEFNSWSKYYEWKGRWDLCTPKTVRNFSAIGYIFGRRLHLATQVPIGLVDVSRGGTTVETWTSRESLEKIPRSKQLVGIWDQRVAEYDPESDLAEQLKNWERQAKQQRKNGKEPRPKPTEARPGPGQDMNRPANCYNGMLSPLEGLCVKGVIWHQGYNNALADARPNLYNQMFQSMIGDWRTLFRDASLPFGIIGFSAGGKPQTMENFEEQMVDAAPFIREAQLDAAKNLKNVGYIASWDQQMNWYHPFKKSQLGERMARWALDTTTETKVTWQPAIAVKHEIVDSQIIVTFDREVNTHDSRDFEGFAIAGEDRHFYPATGKWFIKGKDAKGRELFDRKRIVVSNPLIQEPVAVRYAWARNPIGNGVSAEHQGRHLPIPGFRTDDWDYPEAPIVGPRDRALGAHRAEINSLRKKAKVWAKARRVQEAELFINENKEASKTTEKKSSQKAKVRYSPKVIKLFGKGAVEVLAKPDKVNAYRLPKKSYQVKTVKEFKMTTGPVALEKSLFSETSRVLLDSKSYQWDVAKGCLPDYGVRMEFIQGDKTADVFFCFGCDILTLYYQGKPIGGEDFDIVRPKLVSIVKKIFKDDKLIQELDPKR